MPPTKAKKAAPKKSPDFSSTADIKIPAKLADQVIGQERGVEIIRKAASQRRNVLLVGLPGTGKSMLAQAMAELLPVQKLQDVLIYPNSIDPNTPKVVTVNAGEGKKIIEKARLDTKQEEDSMKFLGILIPLGWFIITYVMYAFFGMHVNIYAATIVVGGFLLVAFTLGSQMRMRVGGDAPKLLIDNSDRKAAPFLEATGARAGALLGDVRHDPLQSFVGVNELTIISGRTDKKISFEKLWRKMAKKYPELVEKRENGYEAIVFPKSEEIYAYGLKNGKVAKARIYSMNKRPYSDDVVEISSVKSKVTVTPEHKVNTSGKDKEASKITAADKLIKLVRA